MLTLFKPLLLKMRMPINALLLLRVMVRLLRLKETAPQMALAPPMTISAAAVSGSLSDDASSDVASSGRKALVSPKANPVEPESVRDSYLEKGAQVLVLDTKHPSVYRGRHDP